MPFRSTAANGLSSFATSQAPKRKIVATTLESPPAPAPQEQPIPDPVISLVMPCLNEEETIGICVEKALEGIARTGLPGEVIVSDNGSEDRSIEIARSLGARVINAPKRGYGNAYLAGFAAARGDYIVMGDSDDTYDFREVGSLIKPLQNGAEYVMGSRFAGQILPGAMPWLHQYIGNPVLTWILNRMFGLKASPIATQATGPSPKRPIRKCGCERPVWSSHPRW